MASDNTTRLFEGAIKVDDGADIPGFEPMDLPDEEEARAAVEEPYSDEHHTLLQWFSETQGRMRLVTFALKDLQSGDPIFRNKSELADAAGVSRHTPNRYMEELVALGIYDERAQGISRYRVNKDSNILRALAALEQQLRERARY